MVNHKMLQIYRLDAYIYLQISMNYIVVMKVKHPFCNADENMQQPTDCWPVAPANICMKLMP